MRVTTAAAATAGNDKDNTMAPCSNRWKLRQHKHIWMYSSFCDVCNADFDTWLKEVKEEVASNLVNKDFNRMLCEMCFDEEKIDKKALCEIHTKMIELARTRGYLRNPFEHLQQQQEQTQRSCSTSFT